MCSTVGSRTEQKHFWNLWCCVCQSKMRGEVQIAERERKKDRGGGGGTLVKVIEKAKVGKGKEKK